MNIYASFYMYGECAVPYKYFKSLENAIASNQKETVFFTKEEADYLFGEEELVCPVRDENSVCDGCEYGRFVYHNTNTNCPHEKEAREASKLYIAASDKYRRAMHNQLPMVMEISIKD